MIWQIQDYQGIQSLDNGVLDKLTSFLDGKDAQIAKKILSALHPYQEVFIPPLLDLSTRDLTLHEAVEELEKKMQRIEQSERIRFFPDEWREAQETMNKTLWDYVDILEGCTTELYQQLDQIGFESWNVDLYNSVLSIKELLSHKIEGLLWVNKRLNHLLSRYRKLCLKGTLKYYWYAVFSPNILDKKLAQNLSKSKKYLGFQFQTFNDAYKGYIELYSTIEKELPNFYDYPILTMQDIDFQDRIKKIFFLLRIWELNRSTKTLPEEDTIRAVRREIGLSSELILKEYYLAIKDAIFEKSRELKQISADEQAVVKKSLKQKLAEYHREIKILIRLLSKEEHFFQETDPKVHTTAFWPASKQSLYALQLFRLKKEVRNLDLLNENFQFFLEQDATLQEEYFTRASKEVEGILHEMGQPLISEAIMYAKARELINFLKGMDELGSTNPHIIDYISSTLSKALYYDWKYHVLHDIPEFHEIYEIHQSIIEPIDDRQHLNRLNKFRRLLSQLYAWIKKGDSFRHQQEINLDINDIKGYLQDFLAYVQRLSRENKYTKEEKIALLKQLLQKLLEYQYLFTQFFHDLEQDNAEEKLLRKQLLFVDQYLENIEIRIQEMWDVYQID